MSSRWEDWFLFKSTQCQIIFIYSYIVSVQNNEMIKKGNVLMYFFYINKTKIQIDVLLDEHPPILEHIHSVLKHLGTDTGRGSRISSEQILRSIIVMYIERVDRQCDIVEHYIDHAKAAGPSSIFSAGSVFLEDLEIHLPLARQVVTQSHRAHKENFSKYRDKFTADKNYHVSTEDSTDLNEKVPVYAEGKKGRRNEEEYDYEHSEEFIAMQKFRAGVEGTISVLKRAFGLRRCLNKGFKSFEAFVGCAVFCHNAVLLSRL